MQTLKQFKLFVDEINASSSRLHKQEVLRKYASDPTICAYLQAAFDPFKVYGISAKKLAKDVPGVRADNFCMTPLHLLRHLEIFHTGTIVEISLCKSALAYLKLRDPELSDLLYHLICKDISLGVDAKTINKEIPGLIPTFNVQLANKYFDKPDYVKGKSFALTTKIDGCRIIALKEKGSVKFFTRAGQEYEGLVDLAKEMTELMPDNICLDGEITLLDKAGLSSKDQYKQTTKIVRTKDKEKHGVKMLVFDFMPASDFKKQKCDLPYSERRDQLDKLFKSVDLKYFDLLPILYQGKEESMINLHLKAAIANNEEGIMINLWDAPYEFKRTNNLLKCKEFQSSDLQIIGFEEGTGKYTGTLGALICEYKGGEVRVGSGLTDEQRKEIWNYRHMYLNTIIEVSYFEETVDSTGKPSLRFPTFKDFRPDKTEPNY